MPADDPAEARLDVTLAGPALGGRVGHGGVLHPLHVGHVVGVALAVDLVLPDRVAVLIDLRHISP